MCNPLVSVIIPSFNQAEFIEDTITSILVQDYDNIEVIVIDGGSSDGTVDILNGYRERIKWLSEPDNGQGDAINKGLQISKGEIIGWLNSDDFYIYKNVVRTVVDFFKNDPSVDILYGDGVWVDQKNSILKVNIKPDFSYNRLKRLDYISQPATFMNRAHLPFPLIRDDLYCALDYELWLRLAKMGLKFKHVNMVWAVMRQHNSTKSNTHREVMWAESRELRNTIEPGYKFRYFLSTVHDIFTFTSLKLKGLTYLYQISSQRDNWTIPLTTPPKSLLWAYQLNLIGGNSPFLFLQHLFQKS